eukprot:5658005-Pleurochrysis_carterae.AAC.2
MAIPSGSRLHSTFIKASGVNLARNFTSKDQPRQTMQYTNTPTEGGFLMILDADCVHSKNLSCNTTCYQRDTCNTEWHRVANSELQRKL